MEGPHDKRRGERMPVGLVVRLSYGTLQELVERYASQVSQGGVFVLTRDPMTVGTPVSFEMRLQSGEAVVRGKGVVRFVQPEDAHARPPTPAGVGIQFTDLDEGSRAIVARMVALEERRGVAPGVASPAPVAARPEHTPTPTRAPTPTIPRLTPAPTLTPSPRRTPANGGAVASQSGPGVAPRPPLDLGLPTTPARIARPSRAVIGIDLGTMNSCAAVVKDGRPYVIPSRDGRSTVPSVVALDSRSRIAVGQDARAQLLTSPKSTVHGAKRLVGRPFDSPAVQEIRSKLAYEIVPDAEGLAAVRLGGETVTFEQISALVLREVKEVAQDHLLEEVNRAVVTVPAYYNERQRAAVRSAGALAGLRVERILNEPTAAALAYAFGRRVNQRIFVYDLGGGTFDASVLELDDNVYEVVSTGGDAFLGGVDFDACLVRRLLDDWRERMGQPFDGDRVAFSRVVDAAERAKCALSERAEFAVNLPFLTVKSGQPVSLETTVTREELVALVEPLVDRTIHICREVLRARDLGPADVEEVLLVGGQSRMPLVHEKVAALFGRRPSRTVHPDEAVALGAALLAHSLGASEGVVLMDVLPMSIGIGLPGGRVRTVLKRNTALPVRKQYALATSTDGQTTIELVVMQGESDLARECEYLGTLRIEELPSAPAGAVKIALTFEVGAEGLFAATARDAASGREVKTVLSAKGGATAATLELATPSPHDASRLETASYAAPRARGKRGGIGGLLKRLLGRE